MGIVSFGPPLSLCNGPARGGVGLPSGPSARSGDPKLREWGECGIGSDGISLLRGAALGAPLMTTRGGAGDVLFSIGERRGVRGAPPPKVGLVPRLLAPPLLLILLLFVRLEDDPSADARSIGDATAGEDGPDAELFVDRLGLGGA